MNKPDIIKRLTELGIAHDPKATKPVLEALLPKVETDAPTASTTASDTAGSAATASSANTDPRAEAWAKVVARIQRDYPNAYEARKANGEFDKIPDSFDPANFKLD